MGIINQTLTYGDIIQIIILLSLVIKYFKGYHERQTKLDTLLETHEIRIENNEEGIAETKKDVRDLYKTKQDKK